MKKERKKHKCQIVKVIASLNWRKFINKSKTQTDNILCFLKNFYYGRHNEYAIH